MGEYVNERSNDMLQSKKQSVFLEDILIACVDGLNGFPQAIEAVYPKTEI